MSQGFDIEIYYNGVGIGDLKTQSFIDKCTAVGQQVFDKLQPFAHEIDKHGGIRIDITDSEISGHFDIEFDYKQLPEELTEKIHSYLTESE